MPSALVTTIGGAASNSYVTVAEATAYFDDRPRSSAWEDADSEDQIKALLQAARVLDTRVRWQGTRVSYEQSMAWPRHSVADIVANDGSYLRFDQLPRWLKEAQCEIALDLLSRDIVADSDAEGVSSLSVGPISIAFEKGQGGDAVLCRSARDLVGPYGDFEDNSTSSVAKVIRT